MKYVYAVISGTAFGGFVFLILPVIFEEYILYLRGSANAGVLLGIWFTSLLLFIAEMLKKK